MSDMRTYKFRAWDDKNKEWLLGYDYENLGGFDMFGEMVIMGEWGAIAYAHLKGHIDVKLMQFTGLKDKNGKEVYMGDIVKVTYPQNRKLERFGHVGWYDHGFAIRRIVSGPDVQPPILGAQPLPASSRIEVIGNIWETPELLTNKGER